MYLLACRRTLPDHSTVMYSVCPQDPLRNIPDIKGKIPDLTMTVIQADLKQRRRLRELLTLLIENKRRYLGLPKDLPLHFERVWCQVSSQARNALLKKSGLKVGDIIGSIATVGEYWSYAEWRWSDNIDMNEYFPSIDSDGDGEFEDKPARGGSGPGIEDDSAMDSDEEEESDDGAESDSGSDSGRLLASSLLPLAEIRKGRALNTSKFRIGLMDTSGDISMEESAGAASRNSASRVLNPSLTNSSTVRNLRGFIFTLDNPQGCRALEIIKNRLVEIRHSIWFPDNALHCQVSADISEVYS